MKARIVITLKPTVKDAQGATIEKALHSLGFSRVKGVRIGKYVEMTVSDSDANALRVQVDEMCQKLLTNPIIEDYRFELEDGK